MDRSPDEIVRRKLDWFASLPAVVDIPLSGAHRVIGQISISKASLFWEVVQQFVARHADLLNGEVIGDDADARFRQCVSFLAEAIACVVLERLHSDTNTDLKAEIASLVDEAIGIGALCAWCGCRIPRKNNQKVCKSCKPEYDSAYRSILEVRSSRKASKAKSYDRTQLKKIAAPIFRALPGRNKDEVLNDLSEMLRTEEAFDRGKDYWLGLVAEAGEDARQLEWKLLGWFERKGASAMPQVGKERVRQKPAKQKRRLVSDIH